MNTFSIKKSFKNSYELLFSKSLFQKIAFVFMATTIPVLLLVSLMERSILDAPQGSSPLIPLMVFIVSLVFILYTSAVSIKTSVSVLSSRNLSISKVLKTALNGKILANLFGFFLSLLLALFAVLFLFSLAGRVIPIVGLLGLALALLVGFFVILRLFFSSYFIVDKKEFFWTAIKKSFKVTQKIQFKLAGLLVLVGIIAFVSGLFLEVMYGISPLLQTIVSYLIFTITLSPFTSLLLASPYVLTQSNQ